MPEASTTGKWMLAAGLALAAVGGLVWLVGRLGLPLGRLPGDFRIERDGFLFYFPLATCALLSVFVTILLNLLARFLRR